MLSTLKGRFVPPWRSTREFDMSHATSMPGDLRMARTLWPVLLASAVGLLPFTVFGTYLVPIAERAGGSVAAVGGLRGLGGLAALLTGVALAPLIDRLPKERVAAGGLAVLAVSSLLGASGDLLLLAAFCLLVGAGTAVLNPALAAAAADHYGSGKAAARAATLVSATQSMAAMLAAPLVALPALLWGWQGDLVAVSIVSLILAATLLTRTWPAEPLTRASPGEPGGPLLHAEPGGPLSHAEPSESERRMGYLASYRDLAATPGVRPLLVVGLLRTAVFMGCLAYLAALFDDRFGLGPGLFALVWTLSGASFFLGNLLTGRLTNADNPAIATERLLAAGLAVGLVSVVWLSLAAWLPLALLLTSVHATAHAVVAACVVSLLVRRSGTRRGSALSLNAAGMSLGVFAGAALGGAGLALAGYAGLGIVFGALMLAALATARLIR